MVTVMINSFLNIAAGIFCLVSYMIFIIKDLNATRNSAEELTAKKNWHLTGGLVHLWMAAQIVVESGWVYGNLMLALMWLFFDGGVNVFALKRKWFYVGTTSAMDNAMNWVGEKLSMPAEDVSALAKFIYIVGSLFWLLVFLDVL